MRPLALFLSLLCPVLLAAGPRNVIRPDPAVPGRMSLDAQNLAFDQMVALFEQFSQSVIIYDRAVLTGRVEAVLNNVDWKDALGSIAETFDHRLVETGPNVYQISRPTLSGEPAPLTATARPAPPARRPAAVATVEPVPAAPPAPSVEERLRDPAFAAACAAFDRQYLDALRREGFSEKEAFQLLLRANPAGLK